MTDHQIDLLIKNAIENRSAFELFDIEPDDTPAKISRETKKAFKRIKKTMFCSPKPERYRRRFAMRYVALALIGASLLAVGVGAYAYCSKFVFSKGDNEMDYVAVESTVSDKTSIEEVYELTYNLDGYKLTSYSERESGVSTCYKKGTHLIKLSQCLINSDDTAFNTEDAVIETIDINGEEAIYIDSSTEYDDAQMLIWTYDGYEFYLIVNAKANNREFEKEQLIEMARSIQIKN